VSQGFKSLAEYTAAYENGQTWFTQFRKTIPNTATNPSGYFDYSYCGGTPVANFYASTPLTAARLDADKGIFTPSVSPAKQFMKQLKFMITNSNNQIITHARQEVFLQDYLLYYPFIDSDALGETQVMDNTQTIPRYAAGKVIVVGQAAASTVGQFTINYTNQDGVAGRVSPINYTALGGGGGQCLLSNFSGAFYFPFVYLQLGDTGVKSIESITFSVGGGGLIALVIVQPLFRAFITQESRRTTTGNLESYGACDEFTSVIHHSRLPEIKDGAVLNLMTAGHAGSLAGCQLSGTLETIWN
jgi:hypothetical protein